MTTIVDARGVTREFGTGRARVSALANIDLDIESGQFVVLLGPSGSGKTTLLNLVGGLDRPSSGELTVDGVDLGTLDDEDLTAFRRDHVGFVFQFFNLIPTLTAEENVEVIAELTESKRDTIEPSQAIDQVGLAERADAFPAQMSGGEQQRVAIARALVKSPRLLLADEPTGSLDLETGRRVLDVMQAAARSHDASVMLVTHNSAIAAMADRVIRLRDGSIVDDRLNPNPTPPSQLEW